MKYEPLTNVDVRYMFHKLCEDVLKEFSHTNGDGTHVVQTHDMAAAIVRLRARIQWLEGWTEPPAEDSA